MSNRDSSSIVPTPEEVAALSKPKTISEPLDEKKILEEAAKIIGSDNEEESKKDESVDTGNEAEEKSEPKEEEVKYYTVSGGPETVNEIKKKTGSIPGVDPVKYPVMPSSKETISEAAPATFTLIFLVCFKLFFIVNALFFAFIFGLPILLEYLVARSYISIVSEGIYSFNGINFPISLIHSVSPYAPQVVVISGILLIVALIVDMFSGSTPKFYVRVVAFCVLAGIIFGVEYYLLRFGVDLFSPLYTIVREQLTLFQ